MSIKSRLIGLEKARAPKVNKYLCVYYDPIEAGGPPEERAKGYKVQPAPKEYGGIGGEPFYLATKADLDAFAARDDVDLATVCIFYKDDEVVPEEEEQDDLP